MEIKYIFIICKNGTILFHPPQDIIVSQFRHFCIILSLLSDTLLGVLQHLKTHGNGYIVFGLVCIFVIFLCF
jgi:hypothetical protein